MSTTNTKASKSKKLAPNKIKPDAAKKGKPAAKTGEKQLTPLQKAALARKNGKAPAKKKAAAKKLTFAAPADFKPFFLEVAIRSDADSLLSNAIKATRFQGRYDPQAEDKKKFDLSGYDVPTLVGIQARLSAVLGKPGPLKVFPADVKERNLTIKVKNKETGEVKEKLKYTGMHRLPKNTTLILVLRVGRRAADNALTVGLKEVHQLVKNPSGKIGRKMLDKKDPLFRILGRTRQGLPAAFTKVQLPPKRVRGANRPKDADEE